MGLRPQTLPLLPPHPTHTHLFSDGHLANGNINILNEDYLNNIACTNYYVVGVCTQILFYEKMLALISSLMSVLNLKREVYLMYSLNVNNKRQTDSV